MSLKVDVPATPAVRALRAAGVEFEPHVYAWVEKGGTRHSAEALGVDEHGVVKTLVMESRGKEGRPQPLGSSEEKLFQGPVADALSHIGQIALLRRLAGAAIRGENYFKAEIAAGRVGAAQPPARMEFD